MRQLLIIALCIGLTLCSSFIKAREYQSSVPLNKKRQPIPTLPACPIKEKNKDSFKYAYELAKCFQNDENYEEAIDQYTKALLFKQKDRNIESSKLYYNLGFCLEKTGDAKKAIEVLNKAKEAYEVEGRKKDESYVQILSLLGKVHRKELSFAKSESILYAALKITVSKYGENSPQTAEIYHELGNTYIGIKKYDKAESFLNKALKIKIANYETKSRKIADVYYAIGRIYEGRDDYMTSIDFHKKSISIIKNLEANDKNIRQIGLGYNQIASCYYYLEDYENTIKYTLLFLDIYKKYGTSKNNMVSQALTKIGACYINLGKHNEANQQLDSSLAWKGFNINKNNPFEIQSAKADLLITLYFKAKNNFKIYGQSGCEEDLQLAHEGYDLCIRLIDYMTRSFDEGDSKQYLLDRFYYIFESIIEVNYQCYALRGEQKYIDRALCYMEKSRSILLKEIMQNARASIVAGIPENLLEQERQWRKHIVELENRRYELEGKAQVNAAFHELGDSLFLLREQHQGLLEQMERDFPRYYELKYADHSAEVPAVLAQLLKPQEALVQYFVGDDNIYTIVYRTDGGSHFVKAPKDHLDEAIAALRENIYAYVLSASDSLAMAYAAGAHQLYNKLLHPVSAHLPNRLTIIPDGLLEYLPFEALLTAPATEQMNFRAYPYCVRKYSISYAYSVLSLAEMQQRNNAPRYRQILAVAPSFPQVLAVRDAEDRRRSFGALQDNATEVAGITKLFPAKTLSGTDATLKNFEALAGDYTVLHLATHAKADNENGEHAYIAFTEVPDTAQGSLLYLKDLYALRLHADMVVLSACETGVGALRRGEGVLSLARGFSYAGANSLITTLWRVSDKESAALMTSFYEGLKEGMAKDEALRQAKISYLDQSSGNRAHPFFWAAFTTIGDTEPLQIPQNAWMWWLLALLPLPAWVVWKKRKPQIAA